MAVRDGADVLTTRWRLPDGAVRQQLLQAEPEFDLPAMGRVPHLGYVRPLRRRLRWATLPTATTDSMANNSSKASQKGAPAAASAGVGVRLDKGRPGRCVCRG